MQKWFGALMVLGLFWGEMGAASAAMLMEGQFEGKPFRLAVSADGRQVAITAGRNKSVVDLRTGQVLRSVGGMAATTLAPAGERPQTTGDSGPFEVTAWGPGPMIAGHGSDYYVITMDGKICMEALISPWMSELTAPASRALALLEHVDGRRQPASCDHVPFAALAAAGWPLMLGQADRSVFRTSSVRFDHKPSAAEFTLPRALAALTEDEGLTVTR